MPLFSTRDFRLQNGGQLPLLELAYETYGRLSPNAGNAVLVCATETKTEAHIAQYAEALRKALA